MSYGITEETPFEDLPGLKYRIKWEDAGFPPDGFYVHVPCELGNGMVLVMFKKIGGTVYYRQRFGFITIQIVKES